MSKVLVSLIGKKVLGETAKNHFGTEVSLLERPTFISFCEEKSG